jgi:hypothetical protein
MLAWRMAKSVEESMNTLMLSHSGILQIPELENTVLNATMLRDPIFGKDFISIPIDGSFAVTEDSEIVESSYDYKKMPIFLGNDPNDV